jgi:hypothetical protein
MSEMRVSLERTMRFDFLLRGDFLKVDDKDPFAGVALPLLATFRLIVALCFALSLATRKRNDAGTTFRFLVLFVDSLQPHVHTLAHQNAATRRHKEAARAIESSQTATPT